MGLSYLGSGATTTNDIRLNPSGQFSGIDAKRLVHMNAATDPRIQQGASIVHDIYYLTISTMPCDAEARYRLQ